MIKRFITTLTLLVLLLGILPVNTVSAEPVKEEFESYVAGGDGDSQDIGGDNVTAMQFTTDNMSHSVTQINLVISKTGSPGALTVAIQEFDTAPSGIDLCSGAITDNVVSTAYALQAIQVDEVVLEGNASYCIVVSAEYGDASNYYSWRIDTGGGLANALSYETLNGGLTWAADGTADNLFQIWGYSTLLVEDVAVFNDYLQGNDTLIVFKYLNVYKPYYPSANPSTYFDLQLLDTDGVTILASTPMKDWGMRPACIYLSASLSTTLTMGSQYYIRVYGQFTGNPSVNIQLQGTDYYGNNLNELDTWARGVAWDMHNYYDTDFVSYDAEKQAVVLNEEGGILFKNGIPSLNSVRPNLFLYGSAYPDATEIPITNSFDSAATYRDMIGDEAADFIEGMGSWINIDGETTATIMMWMLWLLVASIIAIVSIRANVWADIGFPVCAGLAFPVIILGAYLHIMSIVVIVVAAIVAAVMLGYSLILTRL